MQRQFSERQRRRFNTIKKFAFDHVSFLEHEFDQHWAVDDGFVTQSYAGQAQILREEKVNGI